MFMIGQKKKEPCYVQPLKPYSPPSQLTRNLFGVFVAIIILGGLIMDLLAWSKLRQSEPDSAQTSQNLLLEPGGPAAAFRRQIIAERERFASTVHNLNLFSPLHPHEREIHHQCLLACLNPDSAEYAAQLCSYGDTLMTVGKYRAADKLYRNALVVLQRSAGPQSPHYSRTLLRLAEVCHAMQRYEEETELRRRAADGSA